MKKITRRSFLSGSIRGAAGLSLGMATLSRASQKILGANDKVIVAQIGAGNFGHKLVTRMVKFDNVEFKYVCEVDNSRGAGTIKELGKVQGYEPKRIIDMKRVFDDKDIDAVVVSTPEHWHGLAAVWACQAGKDVYVEKNISLSIWESRKMLEAARKYNRIVQCGTQNRSSDYGYTAREYIKSGKLGKVLLVKVFNVLRAGGRNKAVPDSEVPEGLDWDRWLGPAPKRPYNRRRHKAWLNYWDYSTGELGHSTSHQIDFARLALGDPPHPKSVYCAGGRFAYDDGREIPDMQIITYDYGDFVMTVEDTGFSPYFSKSGPDVRFADKFPDWLRNSTRIEIYGTEAIMYLGRMGGGYQVVARLSREQQKQKNKKFDVIAQEHGRYPLIPHEQNFIDCVRSRKRSNGDIEQGHLSATLIHLGNASLRVGNKQLLFDGKNERFTNCDEANKLLKPHYRNGYVMPEKV